MKLIEKLRNVKRSYCGNSMKVIHNPLMLIGNSKKVKASDRVFFTLREISRVIIRYNILTLYRLTKLYIFFSLRNYVSFNPSDVSEKIIT